MCLALLTVLFADMHTQTQLTWPSMLQRLLTVLVYQLNDDEAADDDNFGEEDHVSSFRQAPFALPRQHESLPASIVQPA